MLAFFYTNFLEFYVPRDEAGTLVFPIYLPKDFQAPFVDPTTATGPVVTEIFLHPESYNGQTIPVVGEVISPREIVNVFNEITGLNTEYHDAFSPAGMRHYYPEFADDPLHLQALLGMVNYVVDYGYFRPDRDLELGREISPKALSWRQFLTSTGWRGGKHLFMDERGGNY